MAKSRKEGKPKRNRGNCVKREQRLKKNMEIIKFLEDSLK